MWKFTNCVFVEFSIFICFFFNFSSYQNGKVFVWWRGSSKSACSNNKSNLSQETVMTVTCLLALRVFLLLETNGVSVFFCHEMLSAEIEASHTKTTSVKKSCT
jgi:hypothetical protein